MISVSNLAYEVSGRLLFDDLSFSLKKLRYGLVGPNGIGKSTLARLLSGELAPSTGTVRARTAVFYFAQAERRPPGLTVTDFLRSDAGDWRNCSMARRLVARIDPTLPLSSLSGGEWVRLRLARLARSQGAFVIMDEPTNDLDSSGRAAVADFIANHPHGLLLISHDRAILRAMDEILELSNQGLSQYGFGFDDYQLARRDEDRRRDEALRDSRRHLDKRAKEMRTKVSRQEKRMREGARRAPKQGMPRILLGAMKRNAQKSLAKTVLQETSFLERAQEEAVEQWKEAKVDPLVRFEIEGARPALGKFHMRLEGVHLELPPPTGRLWSRPLDLAIRGSERWRLRGPNGAGKSTLLRLLCGDPGAARLVAGTLKQGRARIAYLGQNHEGLDPERSLLENLASPSLLSLADLRTRLADFGFIGSTPLRAVGSLSGGELLKAGLARLFLGGPAPELLVLDEPTNNLDLPSLALLEKTLRRFPGALLVVTHDEDFASTLELTHEVTLERAACTGGGKGILSP